MGVTGMQSYSPTSWLELTNLLHESCFNAFSRVDMRVDVKIPGGVQAYIVDVRGERYVTRPQYERLD